MANETRVRADFVAGALDATLAIGATSMSSPALADLPAISATQHALISLFTTDGNGRVTKKERIKVTAHTASATTATIVKAQEGTTDQAWASGDKWEHAPGANDIALPRARTIRTAGDLTFGTTWAAMTTAHDLVVTAATDDHLLVGLSGHHDFDTMHRFLDFATMVSSAAVNYVGGTAAPPGSTYEGVGAWSAKGTSSTAGLAGGSVLYPVVAGDISAGTVTLRLHGRAASGTPLLRASTIRPLLMFAINLGAPT